MLRHPGCRKMIPIILHGGGDLKVEIMGCISSFVGVLIETLWCVRI